MEILKEIYNQIVFETPDLPPESGGILGGKNSVITSFYFDSGLNSTENEYIPDTDKLNFVISEWSKRKIEFYGLYHSHYPSGTVLSVNDKKYIEKILKSTVCKSLFFPIVFPKEKMISYKAKLIDGQVIFSREKIICV